MKKFLFILMAASISLGAMAQGKGNGKGKWKKDKTYNNNGNGKHERDDNDDDDRYDRDNNRNGNWNNNQNGSWNNNQNQQGKYSKNIPNKVAQAFYRDFPNANNVSWTKAQGVWTAHFGSGVFNANNTVSYRANGQRVDGNYAGRRTYPNGTQNNNGTGIDRILRRGGIGGN